MKYSIGNLTLEAKNNWEAQLKASEIMLKNGITEGKLIGHYKNGEHVVTNIIFPKLV